MSDSKQGLEIALFDFQSHASMHLNFNEGYIRSLRSAYPDDRILFHACTGHVAELQTRLRDVGNVEFLSIEPFKVPFGWSRHNPVGGRWAAWQCRKTMLASLKSRRLRSVALLGEDGHLYAVIGRRWHELSSKLNKAPLHMILHNHLGDAVRWRSRNPFIRGTDMVAQVQKPLPSNVRILALELGVKEAIAERFPAILPAVRTLEHPSLVSEWTVAKDEASDAARPTRIAFLGNASRTKGFNVFLSVANACADDSFEFHAIGIDCGILDGIEALARRPAKGGLPRRDYIAALADMDFVCLPLSSLEYAFIASGSVTDAIAAAKPLLALRTRTLEGIFERYGPVGYLADTPQELIDYVKDHAQDMRDNRALWVANMQKVRAARSPEALGVVCREF
ncbi:hypothetical protein VVD49_15900 [Uliginosibacterium sp. H3]|uniref:Glycosyl transferases group 1 n=1 Tax=Uliginosibacterium silvisoli TaxID=3114758 RepID=A0ABU6K5N1_9RHOO|nr:hypothetical protein [Uliginosibacterium sp. H3]